MGAVLVPRLRVVLRIVSTTPYPLSSWGFCHAHGLGTLMKSTSWERITGNLFEIEVQYGKTSVMLGRLAREGEFLGVCDIFGEQALNKNVRQGLS